MTLKRCGVFLLLLAVVVGFLFRMSGLSRGLADGYMYHPDTPKQMRAIHSFLYGDYVIRKGSPDYDGYPLFNSHLVEYLCRAYRAIAGPLVTWMGFPELDRWPGIMSLYWITRVWNALLSTLLIWVIHCMGREHFGRSTGLLAAWLLALSPVDIAAAHYESGDTASAFFAVVSVFFAMRIYTRGRFRDYAGAAFFGMCALGAKYHAGMALVPAVVAHALRYTRWRDLYSSTSLRRLLGFGLLALISFFIANPAMFVEPLRVPQDILAFLGHATGPKRLPDEVRVAGLSGKFLFAMERNLPILVRILSVSVVGAVLAGFYWITKRDRLMVILYTLPVTYFFIGVTMRPVAQPVYHTLMTPLLFLIAAFVMVSLVRVMGPWRWATAPVGVTAAGLAFAHLFTGAAEEAFFFRHRDTRQLGEIWARQNVPLSFTVHNAGYGFDFDGVSPRPAGPAGTLWVQSSFRPTPPPSGFFPFRVFHLEDAPLPLFRNPTLMLHMGETEALDERYSHMPYWQSIPGGHGGELIFDGGPVFYANDKMLVPRRGASVKKILVRSEPLSDALVVIQAGDLPTHARVEFGGRKWAASLRPGQAARINMADVKARRPRVKGVWLYDVRASVSLGPAKVWLCTEPWEKGVVLFQHGYYDEASKWLWEAAVKSAHPSLAAMARIALQISGAELSEEQRDKLDAYADVLLQDKEAAALLRQYGITQEYVDALPYFEREAEQWCTGDFKRANDLEGPYGRVLGVVRMAPDGRGDIILRHISLEPGDYRAIVRIKAESADADSGGAKLILTAEDGETVLGQEIFTSVNDAYHDLPISFTMREPCVAMSFRLRTTTDIPIVVDHVRIRPDLLSTLRGMAGLYKVVAGRAEPAAITHSTAYGPLLALGDSYARAEDSLGQAVDCFIAAARVMPEWIAPLERLDEISAKLTDAQREEVSPYLGELESMRRARTFQPTPTVFKGRIRLDGYRLRNPRVHAGDSLGLNLYWTLLDDRAVIDGVVTWLHFVADDERVAFQGDHLLLHDLPKRADAAQRAPLFYEIQVPEDTPPGNYQVRLGLHVPDRNKRIRIVSSELPIKGKSVTLPITIHVEERSAGHGG